MDRREQSSRTGDHVKYVRRDAVRRGLDLTAEARILGVVERPRHAKGRAPFAEDLDFEIGLGLGETPLYVAERQALADAEAGAARGDGADPFAAPEDRIAGLRVGIAALDD